MAQLINLNPTPLRLFEDSGQRDQYVSESFNNQRFSSHRANAIAVSPDGRRMISASYYVVRLWDVGEGVLLKRLEEHGGIAVDALAVSRDGRFIASGDDKGTLIAWDLNIGESLTQAIKAHTSGIPSLAFSPDSSLLATSSGDGTTKLWCTKTWELSGNPITYPKTNVCCVQISPSGALLAIATHNNIQIYDLGTRECIANFKGHTAINGSYNNSLAWMPDGTRLFSAGGDTDPTIREWDTSNWKQVGDPWKGHFKNIRAICLNSNGTLLASASNDTRVRLWRVSDRRTIVVFKHPTMVQCVAFSADDRRILSGDQQKSIFEWPVPEDNLPNDRPKNVSNDDSKVDQKEEMMHQAQAAAYSDFKVLTINPDVRNACITGDFRNALMVLDRDIKADANNHASYANRAFVMARKSDWDHALRDANKSVAIQPSFAGHISKGISLCGKKQVQAARISFDLASLFTNGDLKTDHFLFLIRAIAFFNANEHQEAMLRIGELATCPNVDPVACRIVEAYLHVQLGNIALDGARNSEAVEHFTAAVNASAFFYNLPIHSMYEEFDVLFGWDLTSLWQTAKKQHCLALFRAGNFGAGIKAYQSIMDNIDEGMKADLHAWFATLK